MNWLRRLLFVECPNCASAWTGGHANPQDRTFCVVCSDKQGKMTGRVFRIEWLHSLLVTNRNFKKLLDPTNEIFLWSGSVASNNIKILERRNRS